MLIQQRNCFFWHFTMSFITSSSLIVCRSYICILNLQSIVRFLSLHRDRSELTEQTQQRYIRSITSKRVAIESPPKNNSNIHYRSNTAIMPSTRAGTMNVRHLSVAISSDGSDIVVLPPQSKPVTTRPLIMTPYPGTYGTVPQSASSSIYDEDDDVEMTEDEDSDEESDSGSEYCPSVDLAPSPPPERDIRPTRSTVSKQQAMDIRNKHALALHDVKYKLQHCVPHVLCRGASPNLSYQSTTQPTVVQTPKQVESAFREVFDDHEFLPVTDHTPTPPPAYDGIEAVYDEYLDPDLQPTPTQATYAQDDTGFEAFCAEELETESWIFPYALPENTYDRHLPVCNVPFDSFEYPDAVYTLMNSGVNFLTDYPIIRSPRMTPGEIRRELQKFNTATQKFSDTLHVGETLDWPPLLNKVRTRDNLFVPFSYTNLWQPRTEISRANEGEPLSPKTTAPRGFI